MFVWIWIRKRELKLNQYNQIRRYSANNLENITLQNEMSILKYEMAHAQTQG
jgi:hypothetical protein